MGGDDRRPRVVVLHALRPTSRQTTVSHLLSFRRNLPHADVRYLHFAQPLPPGLEPPAVDALVVNYDFLNYRFTPLWPWVRRQWRGLAERAGTRVAVPQDDFWASRLLDRWCDDWQIDRVLTPLDANLDVLYPRTRRRAAFTTVLTGYADAAISPGPPIADRAIDLGQRVRRMPPHLGRLGQEKSSQAMHFAELARTSGMAVDVSDRNEDAFLDGSWIDFLRSCRFTVSMKGGASRVDPLGLEYLRVQRFLSRRPDAAYDEVASRCFRRPDGIEMSATSPRLFEAAAAGTCQVLPPDDYLGVLEPWVHYLPLERNFSNAPAVLAAMRDHGSSQEIARRAREVLVESGRFDDSALVRAATDGALDGRSGASGDGAWADFVAALDESSRLWREDGPVAHDAAQEAVRALIDARASVDDARALASGADVRGAGTGLQTALRYIQSTGRWEWFTAVLEQSRRTPALLRSPWTWRPL
jgi:hypothetical protein